MLIHDAVHAGYGMVLGEGRTSGCEDINAVSGVKRIQCMMTETTEERRERLKAMKMAAGRVGANNNDNGSSSSSSSSGDGVDSKDGEKDEEHASKRIKLRNYTPRDISLAGTKGTGEVSGKESNEGENGEGQAKEKPVGDLIKNELAQLQTEEINIVPKHPNWDLKQGVQQRVDKLKKRTQRAIVEILREKIATTTAE